MRLNFHSLKNITHATSTNPEHVPRLNQVLSFYLSLQRNAKDISLHTLSAPEVNKRFR